MAHLKKTLLKAQGKLIHASVTQLNDMVAMHKKMEEIFQVQGAGQLPSVQEAKEVLRFSKITVAEASMARLVCSDTEDNLSSNPLKLSKAMKTKHKMFLDDGFDDSDLFPGLLALVQTAEGGLQKSKRVPNK